MSALTETEIVEAVSRGRREGQDQMVCRYAERVFAMIVRQVPDVMDAQELTQDTFMRAFSHIDSYDPRRASLSTWLCRIAYRLTLDFLKRRRPVNVSMEDTQVWQTDISDKELEAFNQNVFEVLELPLEKGLRKLRVFLDHSSAELFFNDGEATFTTHVYPEENEHHMTHSPAEVKIWALKTSVTDEFIV